MLKQTFSFNDGTHYTADDIVNGYLINPVLPDGFDTIPTADRDQAYIKHWFGMPFILHHESGYSVHCLEWDRPRWWGAFRTLEGAVNCAQKGPFWKHEALLQSYYDHE